MKLSDIEFSEYSQNGEDGIIAFLVKHLKKCDRTFLEIGCGNGKQNNTTALAVNGWSGIAIDSKASRVEKYKEIATEHGFLPRVQALRHRVSPSLAPGVAQLLPFPDVFSLDIDSIDYHVAKAMLDDGFRPKIAVLEYNSSFGGRPLTVPERYKGGHKHLYFGAGVEAWKKLFEPLGYSFVTVDSAGINCFFVQKKAIRDLPSVEWLEWADTKAFAALGSAEERFELIRDMNLVEV